MSYKLAMELKNISKVYKLYNRPIDRLLQMLPWNRDKTFGDEFWALKNINLEIKKGDVIGVVGQNGAGKSTLLQIVCNTLTPSSGKLAINGKIAALLELGSGFNPEFTGRQNVYLAGAIAGLSKEQIDKKFNSIVEFSGIAKHINQPVKTYSSGMKVRLAFSVATSVEPDILVIDEALSVGDGAFARKSFDRIMGLKNKGCTILFCSHSLYQVEVLCNKVMWINSGTVKEFGEPASVIDKYQKYLDGVDTETKNTKVISKSKKLNGTATIKDVKVYSDDGQEGDISVVSEETDLNIDIKFVSDDSIPTPSVGVVIYDEKRKYISSCGNYYDNVKLKTNSDGETCASLRFPKIGLLGGIYYLDVILLCEKSIHIYEEIQCSTLSVTQKGSEVGVVILPREWKDEKNDKVQEYNIKKVEESYKDRLTVLFKEVFKEDISTKFWDWKYQNSKHNLMLVDNNDNVLGHYGGMYRALVVFGKLVDSVQVCDTMIAKSARGGTGKKSRLYRLTSEFIDQSMVKSRCYDLVYGFPHKRVMKAAEILNIYTKTDSMVECNWDAKENNTINRVQIDSKYSVDIDSLWNTMKDQFKDRIIGCRDFKYLEYRYINHPKYNYEIYGIVEDRKLSGVIIGRKDGNIFRLMDIVSSNKKYELCISLAKDIAHKLECEKVVFWITNSASDDFKDIVNECRDIDVSIATSEVGNSYKIADIKDKWWLTAGDSDFL